jgi:hypothetical protein
MRKIGTSGRGEGGQREVSCMEPAAACACMAHHFTMHTQLFQGYVGHLAAQRSQAKHMFLVMSSPCLSSLPTVAAREGGLGEGRGQHPCCRRSCYWSAAILQSRGLRFRAAEPLIGSRGDGSASLGLQGRPGVARLRPNTNPPPAVAWADGPALPPSSWALFSPNQLLIDTLP